MPSSTPLPPNSSPSPTRTSPWSSSSPSNTSRTLTAVVDTLSYSTAPSMPLICTETRPTWSCSVGLNICLQLHRGSELWPFIKQIHLKYGFIISMVTWIGWPFQLRSKYSGNLNMDQVWYSNGQKEVGCQMVQYLKVGQMDAILFSYVLVWYLNGQSST